MKKYLLKYISENNKQIRIVVTCILFGMLLGSFMFQLLNQDVKNELLNCIKLTLDIAKYENFESINIIKNGISLNMFVISVVYISAITFIAPLCICLLGLIKGFSIGIYICTLLSVFGTIKGIISIFLIIILPNIIYLPAYIYMSVNAINFHYLILENSNRLSICVKETYKIIISFSLIMLSILIEQLVSFGVINLYIN